MPGAQMLMAAAGRRKRLADAGGGGTPAGDFYAHPSGSDANPGTEAQPFQTIQALYNALSPGQVGELLTSPGDDVFVSSSTQGGTFNQQTTSTVLNTGTGGTSDSQRKTIRASAGHKPYAYGYWFIDVSFVTIEDIYMLAQDDAIVGGTGSNQVVEISGSDNVIDGCILDCMVTRMQGSVITNGGARNKFLRCGFTRYGHYDATLDSPSSTGNKLHAIYWDNSSSCEIGYCYFYNDSYGSGMTESRGYSIQAYPTSPGVWIHHNTFYNTARGTVVGYPDTINVTHESNVYYQILGSNLATSGTAPGTTNNVTQNNSGFGEAPTVASGFSDGGGNTDHGNTNPFKSTTVTAGQWPTDPDFLRLLDGSPAAGRGAF